MTQVFSQPAMDTPVLTPGWTVQTAFSGVAAGGSNQDLTAGAGPGPNTGNQVGYTQQAAPSAVPSDGTATATQLGVAVDAIVTSLQAAGIYAS